MKVYVDNYKKVSSWIWDYDKEKKEFCLKINFSSLDWDEPLNLLSLADYTKQVRKDVCEEIRQKLKPKEIFHPEDDFEIDYDFYYKEDVEEVLDQLPGEDK
jgi:hypothetical protein